MQRWERWGVFKADRGCPGAAENMVVMHFKTVGGAKEFMCWLNDKEPGKIAPKIEKRLCCAVCRNPLVFKDEKAAPYCHECKKVRGKKSQVIFRRQRVLREWID